MGDSAALEETKIEEQAADNSALGGLDTASDSGFSSSHGDLNNAMEELSGLGNPTGASGSRQAPPLAAGDANDLIWDIPVDVNIVLGTTQLSVARLMELEPGEVVELNRRVGEPLDITVNGRKIARGEIVMREDDSSKFAIQVVEIVGR